MSVVTEALERDEVSGARLWDAELHRLRGELLLARDRAAEPDAETAFRRAIDLARRQSAKSWELRTTVSLARLWQRHGQREAAHRRLTEIYGWFTEGFDTADLREARTLLDELSGGRNSPITMIWLGLAAQACRLPLDRKRILRARPPLTRLLRKVRLRGTMHPRRALMALDGEREERGHAQARTVCR